MGEYAYITVESASRGGIHLTIRAKSNGGPSGQIDFDVDHDATRGLVEEVCRKAGLPEPWKRS